MLGFQTTEVHQQLVPSLWKCMFAGVKLARRSGSSKISQHSNVEFYILVVASVYFFKKSLICFMFESLNRQSWCPEAKMRDLGLTSGSST